MSIFLGDQLTEVVEKIIDGKASVHATRGVLDLGADTLPKLMQDNTDRNRTSPFAFTGNKFEFRACGSEQNVSDSNLVLDAAVAKSLKSFADALEGTPEDEFQDAALEYCKKVLTDHQRILFSGDGYSDEWPVEAEKRGLANNKTTADALPAFVSDKPIALFEETGRPDQGRGPVPLRLQAREVQQAHEHRGHHDGSRGASHLSPGHYRLCHQGR